MSPMETTNRKLTQKLERKQDTQKLERKENKHTTKENHKGRN